MTTTEKEDSVMNRPRKVQSKLGIRRSFLGIKEENILALYSFSLCAFVCKDSMDFLHRLQLNRL
ncbi:hypothetical protein V1477_002212 [Vespula maculifrons]|uniref:Uncharacterized protein n=1 Tax=Vespula maculifrons TaxID=7453 RepID=A0ABD2CW09_VESMC